MIVDAGQDVSEIGLRIEAVHLGRFDDGHRACQRFGTGVCPGKEPVLPSDANRAQGAFRRIVINGDPPIFEEEAEGSLPAEPVAESLGQIALAGDEGKLALCPSEEGRDLWGAVLLTDRKTDICRVTSDFAFDIVKRTDAVERLAGDGRFRLVPFVMEVATQVGPTSRLAQAGRPVWVRIVKLGITLVTIGLQDAAGLGQMAMDVFFLPIRREGIDRTGRRCACPGALVADIGPDPPLLHTLAQSFVPLRPIENPDRRVIGMQPGQSPCRVLIVEDQRDNQVLLSRLLDAVGLPWKLAENGQMAVELFQSWQPHFIWMDHRMPVMDGEEATRRIRQLPGGQQVKIVAVTASALREQRAELLAAGMDDFVRKPYRASEIYDCMARHLGLRFVREDQAAATLAPPPSLTPEALATLPAALRDDLAAALQSLDSTRIARALAQVRAHNKGLADTLAPLIDGFDYPTILKALQTLPHG